MTKSAFISMLVISLSSPAWADTDSHKLFELSKGDAGRLVLVSQSSQLQADVRLESVGIRGEYRNGSLLWFDRKRGGGTVVGIGYQARF